MTALMLMLAVLASALLTMLIFAPLEPIDEEIAEALKYETNKEKMGKAILK